MPRGDTRKRGLRAAPGEDAPGEQTKPTKQDEGSKQATPSAIDVLEKRSRAKKTAKKQTGGIEVVSPARDAALGKSLTPKQKAETAYVQALLSGGGLVLFLGVVLATSGLFPDPVDEFIGTFLYPSYSYIVGLFLLGSSVYGVWKVRSED